MFLVIYLNFILGLRLSELQQFYLVLAVRSAGLGGIYIYIYILYVKQLRVLPCWGGIFLYF